ncbi:MAG: hypothetical protein IPK19_11935 [Chloroflexi bacterium]|nr:hypothetical protein [Chloroflexota bacterium]
MSIPALDSYLPSLMPIVQELVAAYQAGEIHSWETAADRIRRVFSPTRMTEFDNAIPGWIEMASYANQQTLIHVMLALASLAMMPEYRDSSQDVQRMAEWIIAFHDVSKQPRRGSHDWTHGFRSAAVLGGALPERGFPVLDADAAQLKDWAAMTASALTEHPDEDTLMHDHRRLPEIVGGIHILWGKGTPAAAIVKSVLFHMSIDAIPEYPTATPLTDAEVALYVDPSTLPLLEIMVLVDCDAWALFHPELRARDRALVLNEFSRLRSLVVR